TRRKPGPAGPALAPQPQVTEQRNIIVPVDRLKTRAAARTRPDHALFQRQPRDADIQEATDHRAEDEHQSEPVNQQHERHSATRGNNQYPVYGAGKETGKKWIIGRTPTPPFRPAVASGTHCSVPTAKIELTPDSKPNR